MATYKLIQDIEAEDHILGPLTLRQFIFALIAAFLLYACFLALSKGVPFLLAFFLPPALFCAFFAFPWGRDQPTETWALAKLRFWFMPRRRIWNQSGIKELVTITVPKKVEHVYSDGLSQTEVKSRLQALANTIDSRGWAIKHIDAVGYAPQAGANPDRLIDIPNVPPQVADTNPEDDIMDPDHNPLAQQFQAMINKSSQDYRDRLIEQLRSPSPAPPQVSAQAAQAAAPQTAPAAQQWFINHNPSQGRAAAVPAVAPYLPPAPIPASTPAAPSAFSAQPSLAPPAPGIADDPGLSATLKRRAQSSDYDSHLRRLNPLGNAQAPQPGAGPATDVPAPAPAQVPAKTSTGVTARSDPAILSLSKNNDLNVSTLAREAQRAKQSDTQEVVISLH